MTYDNEITIRYGQDGMIFDFKDKLKNRCPIQIIIDVGEDKWIALLKQIDFELQEYKNLVPLGDNSSSYVWRLVNDKNVTPTRFEDGDVIRNPTIEEFIQLTEDMAKWNCVYNRKTNDFVIK